MAALLAFLLSPAGSAILTALAGLLAGRWSKTNPEDKDPPELKSAFKLLRGRHAAREDAKAHATVAALAVAPDAKGGAS